MKKCRKDRKKISVIGVRWIRDDGLDAKLRYKNRKYGRWGSKLRQFDRRAMNTDANPECGEEMVKRIQSPSYWRASRTRSYYIMVTVSWLTINDRGNNNKKKDRDNKNKRDKKETWIVNIFAYFPLLPFHELFFFIISTDWLILIYC